MNYENWVKWIYQTEVGDKKFDDDAMIEIRAKAFMAIPKSASKKKRQSMIEGVIRPTKRPDLDNILKIICDALNGVAYHDDAAIVYAAIEKAYSDTPRVQVCLCDIGGVT